MSQIWTDPDTGTKYEMRYDVPQGSTNDRECVLWRVVGHNMWNELPPFADVPEEVSEFWHGPRHRFTKPDQAGAMDNIEEIYRTVINLAVYLKDIGLLPGDYSIDLGIPADQRIDS
jgi:hypothetical protein